MQSEISDAEINAQAPELEPDHARIRDPRGAGGLLVGLFLIARALVLTALDPSENRLFGLVLGFATIAVGIRGLRQLHSLDREGEETELRWCWGSYGSWHQDQITLVYERMEASRVLAFTLGFAFAFGALLFVGDCGLSLGFTIGLWAFAVLCCTSFLTQPRTLLRVPGRTIVFPMEDFPGYEHLAADCKEPVVVSSAVDLAELRPYLDAEGPAVIPAELVQRMTFYAG